MAELTSKTKADSEALWCLKNVDFFYRNQLLKDPTVKKSEYGRELKKFLATSKNFVHCDGAIKAIKKYGITPEDQFIGLRSTITENQTKTKSMCDSAKVAALKCSDLNDLSPLAKKTLNDCDASNDRISSNLEYIKIGEDGPLRALYLLSGNPSKVRSSDLDESDRPKLIEPQTLDAEKAE